MAGLAFPKMLVVACLKTIGWQSHLGREQRDRSGLLISVEVLSLAAWLRFNQVWVRQRFWLIGFRLAHDGPGQMVAGERVVGGWWLRQGRRVFVVWVALGRWFVGFWLTVEGMKGIGGFWIFWLVSEMLRLGWWKWGVVCWHWCLQFEVELLVVVDPTTVAVVFGWLALIIWDRKANHGSLFSTFVRILIMVVSFGLLCLYSYELGCWDFGRKVLPLLWRYSRGQCSFFSMFSFCQLVGALFLHVVWLFLDTVWRRTKWLFLPLAGSLDRDTWEQSIGSLWRKTIFVVRVWALLAHGICNRRFYIRDMSSSSSLFGVVLNLHSHSHGCNHFK